MKNWTEFRLSCINTIPLHCRWEFGTINLINKEFRAIHFKERFAISIKAEECTPSVSQCTYTYSNSLLKLDFCRSQLVIATFASSTCTSSLFFDDSRCLSPRWCEEDQYAAETGDSPPIKEFTIIVHRWESSMGRAKAASVKLLFKDWSEINILRFQKYFNIYELLEIELYA